MEKTYPEFLIHGNHAQYILPVAKHVLNSKNIGVDVGCKKPEWSYPGSILADVDLPQNPWHALNLPREGELEYIFSSHCLEHIVEWEQVLHYWHKCLASTGIIFLYLPHTDCEYWDTRFMTTRRHVNNFTPEQIEYYFKYKLNMKNVFASERDSAFSFCVYGEK
jgi:predicted SAM-dependent methyltransferase